MSDKFDVSKYETVKQRKKRFYSTHEDGRISVELLNNDILEQALIRARVYVSKEDQEKNLPRGIGYAHEIRDRELKTSQYGKQYESVNFTSWVENCEESAVGRALDNAGFFSENSCSQEEMIQVQKKKSNIAYSAAPLSTSKAGYVIAFGQYRGKTMVEVGEKEIRSYLDYIMRSAQEKQKPIEGEVLKFTHEADKYLAETEAPEFKLQDAATITTKDIPF